MGTPPRETFTLDVDRAVILAEWLSSMTDLRILNIESDKLGGVESSTLAFSCKEVTLMEKLELPWTEIRNGGADAALASRNQPQYLQLWNNSIDPDGAALLGDVMGSLTKLQVFGLSGNNIGDKVATEIAPALGKMTQLKELYLRKNNIGSYGASGASALARAFENMAHLQVLHLGQNMLGTAGAIDLAPVLAEMTKLQKLDIGSNNIRALGAATLASALGRMPQLKELYFSNNTIGDEGAAALALAFESMPQLRALHLGLNGIESEGAASLARTLGRVTQLETLNLSTNEIGAKGAAALAPALGKLTQLKVLDLSYNGIGDEGVRALTPALQEMVQLNILDLSSNEIGDAGVAELAPALRAMIQLQKLNLETNGIEKEGATMAFVVENLAAFQTLQRFREAEGTELKAGDGLHAVLDVVVTVGEENRLDLSDMGGDQEGMISLIAALPHLDKLRSLDLCGNTLSDACMRELALSLKTMTELRSLSLSKTGLGREGTHLLGKILSACPQLEQLDLSDNQLDEIRVATVFECLTFMPHLRILTLDDNSIGVGGIRSLAAVLPQCHGLEELNLSRCGFGEEGAEVLSECLKGMPHLKMLCVSSNIYPFLVLPKNVSPNTARFPGQRSDIAWRLIMGEMLKQDDDISSLLPLANTCQMLSTAVSSFVNELATVGLSIEGEQPLQVVSKIITEFGTKITRMRMRIDSWAIELPDVLASMLEQPQTLEELQLYGSVGWHHEEGFYIHGMFEWGGLQVLIDNAEKLKFLQKLSLVKCWERNSFGELVPVLEKMTQLRSLNLIGNTLGPDGAKELDSVLLKMTQLTHFVTDRVSEVTLGKMTQLQQLTLVGTWEAEASALKQITHLKQLYFMGNYDIQDESELFLALGEMVQLQELWLNDNGFGSEDLASALGKLTQLQKLGLGVSYIIDEAAEGLPPAVEPALQWMLEHRQAEWNVNFIGAQGATALASALSNMMELKELYLYGNYIGDEGIAVLAPVFGRMAKLQKLSLGWNRIGDEGAAVLAPVLGRMTQLLKLDLSENNIGIAGAAALAPVLALMTKLQRLNLSGNRIETGNATLSFAKEHLQEFQAFQRFRDAARGNLIADGDFDDILNAVAAENEMDERFDLLSSEVSASAWRWVDGEEEAEELARELVKSMRRLEELNLGGEMGAEGAIALAPALGRMTQLRKLNIASAFKDSFFPLDIGAIRAAPYAPSGRVAMPSGRVKMPSHDIGAIGAAALAPALGTLTCLTKLDLSNNDLGPEGARALASALRKLTQLKDLELSNNNLGYEGAEILNPVLQTMTRLRELGFSENYIEDAEVLVPALLKMPQLKGLDLRANELSVFPSTLGLALLKMTQLKVLRLTENPIDMKSKNLPIVLLEGVIQSRGGSFLFDQQW
jgi:Ran GTPase-activating protein (RanGAP) involved in mRNA processing and transport